MTAHAERKPARRRPPHHALPVNACSGATSRSNASSGSSDRPGTLVVCVLVCLLVAASMMGAATLNALRVRRDMRLQLQMRQTELLLDAGILRAAKQLRNAEDYRGETWQPSHDHVGFDSPLVKIAVQRQPGSDFARVDVVAQLGSPAEDLQQSNISCTRRSHSFTVPLPQPSQDSESSSLE